MSSRCFSPPVQRQARHHCSMRSSGDPKFFSLTRRGKEELERASHFLLDLWPGSSHYYFCWYPINQNLFTCPHLYPRKAGENVSMCTSKTSSKRKERKHSRKIINSLWNQWMACPPLQGDRSFFRTKQVHTHKSEFVCYLNEWYINQVPNIQLYRIWPKWLQAETSSKDQDVTSDLLMTPEKS